MKILLTGHSGFIGAHLAAALREAGHEVIGVARRPARASPHGASGAIQLDFSAATRASVWQQAVTGVDVVINAVGILRERGRQRFAELHALAPCALFEAAAAAGVRRIIQVSALGADENASSRYHLTKKAADDCLVSLGVDAAIVQPSLVFGPGGTSARLFGFLASLPLIPVPGHGEQRVQPVLLDDVVDGVVALVQGAAVTAADRRIPFVGPEPMTLRAFYERLRRAQGHRSPARFLDIPRPLVRTAARLGSHVPGSLLDLETWNMLERGNVGDPAPLTALLGRPPRDVTAASRWTP